MRETIVDIERVFAVLDGTKPKGRGLLEAIDKDRGRGFSARQSLTESGYFRIRGYKNGNAHLWFVRDDLVEKANRVLADYYGEVLPDGVPEDVTPKDIARCTALCKDLQFYPTPPSVIDALLSEMYFSQDSRVLEPSAGYGAIVTVLLGRGVGVDAVEVDANRFASLRNLERANMKMTAIRANFLCMTPVPVYSHVVMNPPFFDGHYMAHVMKAFEFLKPGGKLVSVLPASVEFNEGKHFDAFRAWCTDHKDCWGSPFSDLPAESFASSGTRINTCYVRIRRKG